MCAVGVRRCYTFTPRYYADRVNVRQMLEQRFNEFLRSVWCRVAVANISRDQVATDRRISWALLIKAPR